MSWIARRIGHLLAQGHWPDYIYLGPFLKCAICDLGTPTGSSIRPTPAWPIGSM